MILSAREAFPGLYNATTEERLEIIKSPAYRAWREEKNATSRLSIPSAKRITLITSLGILSGGFLGISHGARERGLRFRAENAHRLPDTQTGWYLYHKSKNYNMALGGVKEGFKMGVKVGFWVGAFAWLEDGWDEWRGERDVANTVLASMTVAGGFAIWNRFPLQTAARTAKSGLAVGLLYGFAQDAVASMRGRRPAYVEFLTGVGKKREPSEETLA